MLAKPVIYDGSQQRIIQQGDTLALGEFDASLTTVGAGTLLAVHILSGFLNRTGVTGGAFADTLDTVSNILAGLQNQNSNGVQPGTSIRFRYKNNATTQTATVTAGTGWTVSGTMTVATNTWRDFLITFQSTFPSQIIPGILVNASAVVTGMSAAQTALLQPGMAVSGTNIAASSTILSIQSGVGVTLNNAATGNSPYPGSALTFVPTATITNEGAGTL
jgi:hypothetical protein